MIDPIELSQALIKCPSVTPKDEGSQQVLIDALSPLGFKATKLQYGEILNNFIRLGDNGPHFCFAGHTDVVPAGDEKAWTHGPFNPVVKDGILYGRGSADMKCNIACFAAAVAQFIAQHGAPKGSISFLITGDEEAKAVDGTVKVLEWMEKNGQVPDVTLVGEPSNPDALGDEIRIGRRGSFTGIIKIKGKQGHTAYPQRADNPLPRLVKMLDALASYEFDKGTEFFAPSNLQLTTIDVGNKADNVIPAGAEAHFNMRFNDKWTPESLEKKIREILDGVSKSYELSCWSNAVSFITKPGPLSDIVVGAVREVTGRAPAMTTGGGTSDARFIQKYSPVVECGLVNKTIHQVDEHVAVEDLHKLTEIYRLILERYFT